MSTVSQPKTGVLLVNLGTPDQPDAKAVRRYLREFLSDKRVIQTSKLLWWPLLNLLIAPTRSPRTARLYQKVWRSDGSPLLVFSQQQRDALAQAYPEYLWQLAMTYGEPSIRDALAALLAQQVERLVVLPLYPQYSATTSAAVFDAVARALRPCPRLPSLMFIDGYADDPGYIDSLAASVRQAQAEHGQPQLLLMSFHGMPVAYLEAGDPYYHYCQRTAQLLAESLGLNPDDWRLCFQSRFGPKAWLQPYTDQLLTELPKQGITRIAVICPGFAVDCLETLEEIAETNRELFLHHGGESYHYIPALNADPAHIQALGQLVERHIPPAWRAQGRD